MTHQRAIQGTTAKHLYYISFQRKGGFSTRFISWHRQIRTAEDVLELNDHLDQWIGPNTLLLAYHLLEDKP